MTTKKVNRPNKSHLTERQLNLKLLSFEKNCFSVDRPVHNYLENDALSGRITCGIRKDRRKIFTKDI